MKANVLCVAFFLLFDLFSVSRNLCLCVSLTSVKENHLWSVSRRVRDQVECQD